MAETPTVLLHLSDIHFRHGQSGTIADLDSDLRDQLERSIGELYSRLGVIHGIIVSGDIAFRGSKEEYLIATEWLKRICDLVGCESENVWTVPGNHDVDREVIEKSNLLQLMHKELRDELPNRLDERLRRYLFDDLEAGAILFRPLQNYNSFAFQFKCEVSASQPFWEHNLRLNDGSTLRIRGATSTIVSDRLDDKKKAQLMIGSVQSLVKECDGVEHLFVCHHPPDWLTDQDNVDQHLRIRTRIQLFGHKHVSRIYAMDKSLRIVAGATHPDRNEDNWEPAFNALSIYVKKQNDLRSMELCVYPYVWSKDLCFKDVSPEHWSFPLPPWNPPASIQEEAPEVANSIEEAAETSTMSPTKGRLVNPARRLTYRFMRLPYQMRIDIAQKLQLIENEDSDLKDPQRYEAYFRRAKDRRILANLWEAIERAHGDEPGDNPFLGQ